MLKHLSPVLRYGVVVATVALLPLTEAAASADDYVFVGVPPPIAANADPIARSCAWTLGTTGTVQIIAGPANALAGDITQNTNFPVKVNSSQDPSCPASVGQCLKWEYKWIYTGVSPGPSLVTLDSDLALWEARGGVPAIQGGLPPIQGRVSVPPYNVPNGVGAGIAEVRIVRFTANSGASGRLRAASRIPTRRASVGSKVRRMRLAVISCSPNRPPSPRTRWAAT
jgi:hypothetical protein